MAKAASVAEKSVSAICGALEPGRDHRRHEAGATTLTVQHRRVPGDVGDPRMTQRPQVLDGLLDPRSVSSRSTHGKPDAESRLAQGHCRQAQLDQERQARVASAKVGEKDAVHPVVTGQGPIGAQFGGLGDHAAARAPGPRRPARSRRRR